MPATVKPSRDRKDRYCLVELELTKLRGTEVILILCWEFPSVTFLHPCFMLWGLTSWDPEMLRVDTLLLSPNSQPSLLAPSLCDPHSTASTHVNQQ